MPTDEEVGALFLETTPYAGGITSGPASDVGHPYGTPIAFEMLMLRKIASDQLVIDIAVDGDQWGPFGEGIGHREATDVPGMPDFIAFREVMQDPVIHVSMGVTDQTDAHRGQFRD